MIWSLIIFIAVLITDLVTDLRLWKAEKSVNHQRGALLRLLGLIPAVLIYWPVVLLIPLYGVLFDGAIASLKGLGWFYLGTTARLDILQRNNPFLIYLKYVLAMAGLFLFIKIQLS